MKLGYVILYVPDVATTSYALSRLAPSQSFSRLRNHGDR